jgi:hypothetical protein
MNPVALLTGIGSIVGAARSVTGALRKSGSQPAETDSQAFAAHLEAFIARFIQGRDADKNGTLSLAEMGGDKKTFVKLDTNGDGQLTAQELRPLFASSPESPNGAPSASA